MASPEAKAPSRRGFLRTMAKAAGATLLAGSAVWWYGSSFEPRRLEVARVRVPLPRLPRAFDGLTIGQISDLHLGPYVGAEQVRAAVDAVLALRPDVAIVTGDYVSRLDNGEAELVVRELSRLASPLGVFAILGNHDHWTNAEVVAGAVRRADLTLLRNGNSAIERSGEVVYIAGVDDVWEGHDDLAAALSGVPDAGCAILLAHEPDFADEAAREPRVALQVSGHSHGGQVRVPGFGALLYPPFARKYGDGLRRVGSMRLYGNRGIGVVFPPVRVNCPPEVTLLELVAH